jgi:hypothetical protein
MATGAPQARSVAFAGRWDGLPYLANQGGERVPDRRIVSGGSAGDGPGVTRPCHGPVEVAGADREWLVGHSEYAPERRSGSAGPFRWRQDVSACGRPSAWRLPRRTITGNMTLPPCGARAEMGITQFKKVGTKRS